MKDTLLELLRLTFYFSVSLGNSLDNLDCGLYQLNDVDEACDDCHYEKVANNSEFVLSTRLKILRPRVWQWSPTRD